jgi:fatty acid-binding protein DegV
VPGVAAWAGRSLGLRPLIEFRGGKIRPLRPVRGDRAAFDAILDPWRRSRTAGRLHVAALHALAAERAEQLLGAVREEVEPATAFVGPFSSVMVAHTGPGLLGLAWWWETD